MLGLSGRGIVLILEGVCKGMMRWGYYDRGLGAAGDLGPSVCFCFVLTAHACICIFLLSNFYIFTELSDATK